MGVRRTAPPNGGAASRRAVDGGPSAAGMQQSACSRRYATSAWQTGLPLPWPAGSGLPLGHAGQPTLTTPAMVSRFKLASFATCSEWHGRHLFCCPSPARPLAQPPLPCFKVQAGGSPLARSKVLTTSLTRLPPPSSHAAHTPELSCLRVAKLVHGPRP